MIWLLILFLGIVAILETAEAWRRWRMDPLDIAALIYTAAPLFAAIVCAVSAFVHAVGAL